MYHIAKREKTVNGVHITTKRRLDDDDGFGPIPSHHLRTNKAMGTSNKHAEISFLVSDVTTFKTIVLVMRIQNGPMVAIGGRGISWSRGKVGG